MVSIFFVIYILIIIIEVPNLLKKKMYPELGAFGAVLMIGIYMTLAFYYQWPLAGLFNTITDYMAS